MAWFAFSFSLWFSDYSNISLIESPRLFLSSLILLFWLTSFFYGLFNSCSFFSRSLVLSNFWAFDAVSFVYSSNGGFLMYWSIYSCPFAIFEIKDYWKNEFFSTYGPSRVALDTCSSFLPITYFLPHFLRVINKIPELRLINCSLNFTTSLHLKLMKFNCYHLVAYSIKFGVSCSLEILILINIDYY